MADPAGIIAPHETEILLFQPDFGTMVKAQVVSTAIWSILFLAFYILVFVLGAGADMFPILAESSKLQIVGYGILAAFALFVGLMVYIAFHMWVFGELGGWHRVKGETWILTDHALHLSHPEEAGEGFVPLHAIQSANKHFLFSIRLKLENKQSIVLRYLKERNDVFAQITTAMEKARHP